MLPPTRASLLPHLMRDNYIALRDKSCTYSNPELPSIEQNDWQLDNNIYVPVRCLTLLHLQQFQNLQNVAANLDVKDCVAAA